MNRNGTALKNFRYNRWMIFFDRDYYWDTKTKQWKKQQVMEAHPLPKE